MTVMTCPDRKSKDCNIFNYIPVNSEKERHEGMVSQEKFTFSESPN